MKKLKKPLRLDAETLRTLTPNQLAVAAGGLDTQTCSTNTFAELFCRTK